MILNLADDEGLVIVIAHCSHLTFANQTFTHFL
jgi:hypothetical protein